MLKLQLAIIFSAVAVCATAQDNLTAVPVHGNPVWQEVQSVPAYQAQAPQSNYVEVKSLTTHQVIGWVPVGYRFLSFGSGEGIISMALNGEIGYLPRASVGRVYASTAPPPKPPAGPVSLEQYAKEYKTRVETGAGVSLHSKTSIVATSPKANEFLGEGAIPGMPGAEAGYLPEMGPGATLATGGPQALGGMVNSHPQK